jgi:hypothetical protein
MTTAGYAGLIAANVLLIFIVRSREPQAIRPALAAWRRSVRIFGPSMLLGIFFGFWVAWMMHVSPLSHWLVAAYGVVVAAIAVQVSVMVPWQLRSDSMLDAGTIPNTMPVALVLAVQCALYTTIVWLMMTRPG